jgi:hypothetical protein
MMQEKQTEKRERDSGTNSKRKTESETEGLGGRIGKKIKNVGMRHVKRKRHIEIEKDTKA